MDNDEVYAALCEVLRKADGSMLGRYVLVAESLEADGSRTTWVSCGNEQAEWEVLGLLDFGRMAIAMSDGRAVE